jgi:ClpP class serine protease
VNELAIGMMLFAPMPDLPPFEMCGPVAVVDVGFGGALSQREGAGWDSYPSIASRLRLAFAEPTARAVAMRVDSPGGDALGCFELFQEIRDMAKGAGKDLYAFIDGQAASAAFAIACSATKAFIPPAGMAGSVGVMVPSVDMTAADAAAGLKYTMFSSGTRKLDGNPHIRMTDDAAAEIKARVHALADIFFDVVARGRAATGATQMSVRALEGRMFVGEAAVKAGLVDGVKTWAEVLALASGAAPAAIGEQAMKLDSEKRAAAIQSIRAAYGDDKEGCEKAIKAAFPDEGKDPDEEKKKEEEKSKARAAEDEKEKEKAAAAALAAKAQTGDVEALRAIAFDATKRVQAMEAQLAAEREQVAREKLVAKRPDFTEPMLKTLALMPLDKLQEAVETWPRVGAVKLRAVDLPVGAQGGAAAGGNAANPYAQVQGVDPVALAAIDRADGRVPNDDPVTFKDGAHEMSFMTYEQAQAHAERLKKAGVL